MSQTRFFISPWLTYDSQEIIVSQPLVAIGVPLHEFCDCMVLCLN